MAAETNTIVIMGGAGDLAKRKLLPALFQLMCKGRLPESLDVVGFGRTEYSDDQYRELMWGGSDSSATWPGGRTTGRCSPSGCTIPEATWTRLRISSG